MRRFANGTALVLVTVLGLSTFAAASATTTPPTANCATVGIGAHGPAVATLQQAVGAGSDGDFGPLTAKAVAHWQHRHGLKATGSVDAATWKKLPRPVAWVACGQQAHGSGVALTCTTLKVGAVGPAVAVLQRALHVGADGGFGPITRNAVLAAQKRLKLARTGVVDAATWAALGRTGSPVCVAAVEAVHVSKTTPAPAPTPAPVLPADWAQQEKVRGQVAALAATLPSTPAASSDQVALKALKFATAQTGKPYKWGGVGPASYDCSGLVQTSYRNAGLTLPRVAADQYGFGTSVPLDKVQQGDLLFYAIDVTKPATIYHVVIYAGSGKIVDAPYTGAYVGTRPLWTKDLLPVAWRPSGSLVLPAKPGATGWTVSQLQQALDRDGATLTVDGGYGPATTAAVKAWQGAKHLPVTGVTDLSTWLSL